MDICYLKQFIHWLKPVVFLLLVDKNTRLITKKEVIEKMKIRILTKGGDREFAVSGNPIIIEIIGSKKHIYHINPNGTISKIRGKKHRGVVEMLENRQVNYQK